MDTIAHESGSGTTSEHNGLRETGGHMRRASIWSRAIGAARLALFALPVGLASLPEEAAAAPTPHAAEYAVHPDLVRAQLDFDAARGGDAYVALGRIWDTWERANPRQVEEALDMAAQSTRHDAAVRAHAALLRAYARLRRGDLAAAQRGIRELGYVENWLLVGPFDNEGKSGLTAELGPEAEPQEPIVPGRAYSGKERPVRWRVVPAHFPYGWVDTGSLLRPEVKVCAVATTFVSGGEEQKRERNITAWVGVQGAFKLYFNGQEVLQDAAYRGLDAGRYGAALRLRPGLNRLTLKVCGEDSAPIFSLRLADERGVADATLTASSDVRASEQAAANVKAALADQRALPALPKGLQGPMQDFERRTAGGGSARDLELFATYLLETGGDDKTVHQARGLARKAAEKQPTVERLLLAASTSEDRNQAARWIEQADRLARGERRIDVLLGQAWLAATGPNPRDAFPLYDRVLALDPDSIPALRGRVELFNAAGLKLTALSLLESALARNPHSVLLLNMTASQLAALGRVTEAAELEERYFARRFDDATYLTSSLDLAVSRQNERASEHWLGRLLGTDPQNLWVHQVASRVRRSFAQPDRALAELEVARQLAPEDVSVLRGLADLHGELGRPAEQLRLMQELLKIQPQDRDARFYVEHIQPPEKKPDEEYAYPPERFLPLRHAPAPGENRRTLRDLTVTTVYPNGLSSEFRQIVFQPLTDSAAAMSRQYGFQYDADSQMVQLLGARVFRGDGRVDEAIESGEGAANDPSIAMYTSGRNFYVQFPRLEPGDVVELRYRIDDVTPRNEFADYFGDVVYFGSDEPTQNAQYVLITPKSRKLHVDPHVPGLKTQVREVGENRIYDFTADNLRPIRPEPSMPPFSEVLPFVHVSTYATWKDLGRWYWGLVQDQFDLDEETRKLARDITKGAKTDLEKVKAVYGWVVKNTRYVALEFGIYGFKPRRCVQTVARGWGDCKDKATVIVTLLDELGIDSTLVVLRTQMRGDFHSKLPSFAPFDHAIVYVPSLDLYLDGTAEHTGSGELPTMDQGALGLLVNRGDAKLVHLPPPDPSKNVVARTLSAELGKDGSAKVNVSYEVRGQAASSFRRRYEAKSTVRERVSAALGSEFPGFEVKEDGITTGDFSDIEAPVELTVRGRAPSFGRKQGAGFSVPVTPGVRLTPDYASLTKRTQDVRIVGFSTRDEKFVVDLAPGMKVISAPPEVKLESRFGALTIQVERRPSQVVVHTRLSLSVDRVKPADYAAWRAFAGQVDQALSHRLTVEP